MKRFRSFAIKIILSLVILLSTPLRTNADGMIIPQPNYTMTETDQKAVIWHDGKSETLILSITFKGDSKEFVWVVPVPAKPNVEAGVDELFTGLTQLTNISPNYTDSYGTLNLAPAGSYEKSTVTVIETKKVDIYDIAVLTAEDTSDLREWLEENDYNYPQEKEHLLKSYVNKGWFFVAAKVDTESLSLAQGLKTGHATPLKITFESEKIVYPLKISGMDAYIPSETENKIVNAFSFEDSTTQGWYGGKVLNSDAFHGAKSYSQSFKLSPQSSRVPAIDNYISKTLTGLTVGKSYVFSAYLKPSAGSTGYARLAIDNQNLSSETVSLASLNDWQRLELPFTATKNYHQLKLVGEGVSTESILLWDAVQIEEGLQASEFTRELVITTTRSTRPKDDYVNILVYVFADHKQEAPGWRIDYAGKVNASAIKRLALNDNGDPWIETKKGMYLTRLSRNMRQSEMSADVYLRQSGNDNPVGNGSSTFLSDNAGVKIFLVLLIPLIVEAAIFGYIWYRRYKK